MIARLKTGGLLLALFVLFAAPVQAQAPDFDDATLDAFAEVALEVNIMLSQAQQSIQNAASEEDRQAKIQELQARIDGLIADAEGISQEDYARVETAAQENPDLANSLRERIMAKLQARQNGGAQN